MPQKTECQQSFELETLTWGLLFDRDEDGNYSEYNTGIVFGTFQLGWDAAMQNRAKNA